jgi:branched-chain amino acid transport system substrate-binding protein
MKIRFKNLKPTITPAGVYSSLSHCLQAVALGWTHGDVVAAKMREPGSKRGLRDLFKLQTTIPAQEAFQPLSESTCALVKK